MIVTVHGPVTPPAAADTLPVRTLELVNVTARGWRLGLSWTVFWPLIRSIGAIHVSITTPERQHTHRVVALKGTTAAGWYGAGSLIRAIRTVIVLVAYKGFGYTLAIGTFKLIILALFGRW